MSDPNHPGESLPSFAGAEVALAELASTLLEEPEAWAGIRQTMIRAHEFAQQVMTSGFYDPRAGLEEIESHEPDLDMSTILVFLSTAGATPNPTLDDQQLIAVFDAIMTRALKKYHNALQQAVGQTFSLDDNLGAAFIDAHNIQQTAAGLSVAAAYAKPGADELMLIPNKPTTPPSAKAGFVELETKIQAELGRFIEFSETERQYLSNHPDLLLVAPPTILSRDYLEQNTIMREALMRSLNTFILLRAVALNDFSPLVTQPRFNYLWKIFFKRYHDLLTAPTSDLRLLVEPMWENRGGLPGNIKRAIRQRRLPEREAAPVRRQVTAVIDPPEILQYHPGGPITYQVEGQHLKVNAENWPADAHLHLVIQGLSKKRRVQTTQLQVLTSTQALAQTRFSKPDHPHLKVWGFFCDRAEAFPNRRSLPQIPSEFQYSAQNLSPKNDPPPSGKTGNHPSDTPSNPKNTQPDGSEPTPLPGTPATIWQTSAAIALVDGLDDWRALIHTVEFTNNQARLSLAMELPNWAEQAVETLVVQLDPWALLQPDVTIDDPDLAEEIFPSLAAWLEPQYQTYLATKQRQQQKTEVLAWQQGSEFRHTKAEACAHATGFQDWLQYANPQGLGFEWDRALFIPRYQARAQQLIDQFQQAGVAVDITETKIPTGPSTAQTVAKQATFTLHPEGQNPINFTLHINQNPTTSHELFRLEFPEHLLGDWQEECGRWGIGFFCLLGISLMPPAKSPFKTARTNWNLDPAHFTFTQKSLALRSRTQPANSSYQAIIDRMNQGRGRIPSLLGDGNLEHGCGWADFATAGWAVFTDAHYQQVAANDGQSGADYETILNSTRWRQYTLFRLWRTLKMGRKLDALDYDTGVGPLTDRMKNLALEVWNELSDDEKRDFYAIDDPAQALNFAYQINGQTSNFVDTFINRCHDHNIGLHLEANPVCISFDALVRFCAQQNVVLTARTPADLAALKHPLYQTLGLQVLDATNKS